MMKKTTSHLMLIMIALFFCMTLKAFSQSGEKTVAPTPKDTRKTFKLQIEVMTGDPPKRVEGASVYVESTGDNARYTKDARTNREGIVNLDQVPHGRVLIQVMLKEYDTFGYEYTLTKDNEIVKNHIEKKSRSTHYSMRTLIDRGSSV
jgi:hypothetical protein